MDKHADSIVSSDGAKQLGRLGGDGPFTILYLDHTSAMSGGEIALLHLLEQLDRTCYVPVVVLCSDGPLRRKLVDLGIETHIIPLDGSVAGTRKDSLKLRGLMVPSKLIKTMAYACRLARFTRMRRVDLIHTNSLKADIIGGIAAKLVGTPVVWHVRDRIADDYLPRTMVRIFRWLCRVLPDYIITNSKSTLESLCTGTDTRAAVIHSGIVRANVRVVHDGVPGSDARARPATDGGNGPLIGLVGRISPWKGQHIFLRAAEQIRGKYPSARFEIVGSAMFGEEQYEADTRTLATTLGLDGCVRWLGFCPNVQEVIGRFDLLVHASTTGEPFGQVVVEGMAAGKPVVATRGGGVVEIVDEGVTGLLVPMGDADAMARAVMEVLADPTRARDMGEAGRRRVLEHFTIELTSRKVEQLYRDVLSRVQPRRSRPRRGRAAVDGK